MVGHKWVSKNRAAAKSLSIDLDQSQTRAAAKFLSIDIDQS
jgi:hypothetical protein